MPNDTNDFRTPGQLIEHLLARRGWTKRTLAVVLGIGESSVAKITAGKQDIDAELALVLEEAFGEPAERFLSLQKEFELARARIVVKPDPDRRNRALLYGDLPVADMIKRGWINAESVRDTATVQSELMRFFDVNRLEDIEILPHNAKKTEVNVPVTPAQLAWLYRVKKIASDMLVAPYSPQAVHSAIAKLKAAMPTTEGVAKVPRIMAECGIRFVLVESLPTAKIDGVCFWLNEQSPVVGMSLRFDRIDNFWFVLRHELEHVAQQHGRANNATMLDTELEKERADTTTGIPEEDAANHAAQEFCVPHTQLDAFVARKDPFFSHADIIGFSRLMKVHPGILAGQLQRKTGRYERFRDYLVKVREIVSPNAIKDGWGDVAPVES